MEKGPWEIECAYKAAEAKMIVPDHLKYDENGNLKPEFALTDKEKNAMAYYKGIRDTLDQAQHQDDLKEESTSRHL